jgi:hypothetical protein
MVVGASFFIFSAAFLTALIVSAAPFSSPFPTSGIIKGGCGKIYDLIISPIKNYLPATKP